MQAYIAIAQFLKARLPQSLGTMFVMFKIVNHATYVGSE